MIWASRIWLDDKLPLPPPDDPEMELELELDVAGYSARRLKSFHTPAPECFLISASSAEEPGLVPEYAHIRSNVDPEAT